MDKPKHWPVQHQLHLPQHFPMEAGAATEQPFGREVLKVIKPLDNAQIRDGPCSDSPSAWTRGTQLKAGYSSLPHKRERHLLGIILESQESSDVANEAEYPVSREESKLVTE